MGLATMDVKDLGKLLKKNTKTAIPARIPEKRGINLAQSEDEVNKKRNTIIFACVGVVVLAVLVKFGIIDLYSSLNKAQSEYDMVHEQHEVLKTSLADYNEVLLEYRTYSMDWLDTDTSGRYVSVPRRSVMDMVETMVMPKGEVSSFSISGDNLSIAMSGLNLKQVSQLCQELETVDFVKSATVDSASTTGAKIGEKDDVQSGSLTFNVQVVLQRAVSKGE